MNYDTGHPWYYVLGGKVLSIREIFNQVSISDYKGYNADEIGKALGNNSKLCLLKADTTERLKKDISVYRQSALKLHRYRKLQIEDSTCNRDTCVDVS